MKNLVFLSLLLILASCLPDEEKVSAPGMINETIYSGYLNTANESRKLHYVFVAARQKPQSAPLTIWLNGGPGCSSLIGMLQQIGPYLVGNHYQSEKDLIKNQYSWNSISNLLFLESPAVVGFSINGDQDFQYNDSQTATDAFMAIKYFVKVKAKQFSMTYLYLAGQGYAGKYIPDITEKILRNNQGEMSDYIFLQGILVGNGVMNFVHESFSRSKIQYLNQHDFIDDRLWTIYRESCNNIDFNSPRCKYFRYELQMDEDQVNKQNVYEICRKVQSSQTVRLMEAIQQFGKMESRVKNSNLGKGVDGIYLGEILECPNDNGLTQYWNSVKKEFHVENITKKWLPCSQINYTISPGGSMKQYADIFLNKGIRIWLYNGDWDSVVPLRDTQKNLEILQFPKNGQWLPWFIGNPKVHIGFYQYYDQKKTRVLISIKGGSHMVPRTKPQESYQMFFNFINNRPINTPVDENDI